MTKLTITNEDGCIMVNVKSDDVTVISNKVNQVWAGKGRKVERVACYSLVNTLSEKFDGVVLDDTDTSVDVQFCTIEEAEAFCNALNEKRDDVVIESSIETVKVVVRANEEIVAEVECLSESDVRKTVAEKSKDIDCTVILSRNCKNSKRIFSVAGTDFREDCLTKEQCIEVKHELEEKGISVASYTVECRYDTNKQRLSYDLVQFTITNNNIPDYEMPDSDMRG